MQIVFKLFSLKIIDKIQICKTFNLFHSTTPLIFTSRWSSMTHESTVCINDIITYEDDEKNESIGPNLELSYNFREFLQYTRKLRYTGTLTSKIFKLTIIFIE